MQMRKNSSAEISVLQLKNILGRIRDDINMNTLTIAIRQQCLEEQQTSLKDKFLTFFLRCEGKLRRYGNCEWNRVINNEIKKIVGFEKMQLLLKNKLVGHGFAMIQRVFYLDEQSKVQQKLYDEFSDLRDMQISDEVKTKTKFFFKWCKFIEEKKVIKRMKNKQIQDLKKSKVFHQYSVKFQTFMQWKQYLKRIKTTRERGYILQQKTKKSKIVNIFTKIKEKTEIITIEKLLEEAVETKMEKLRNKSVFKKLKIATRWSKEEKQQLQRKNNIWFYRFFNFINKKGDPLLNKSSVQVRKDIVVEHNKICLQTSLKGLKMLMNQTMERIKMIKFKVKTTNMKKFIQIKRYLKKSGTLKRQMKFVLRKSFFASVMKNMTYRSSFEKKFDQKKKIIEHQMKYKMLKNSFIKCFTFKLQKTSKDKKIQQTEAFLEKLSKKRIYKSMKLLSRKKQQFESNFFLVQYLSLIKLFKRKINSFKEWKLECSQLKFQLDQHHENKLRKKAFRGLRMTKSFKKGQKQTLGSVIKMLEKKVKVNSFENLFNRYKEFQRLQKLMSCSEFILLKLSFGTILNRMLSKKMKMKTFSHKQENKLKRKLFDLLVKNNEMMSDGKQKVKQIFKTVIKRQFINKVKDLNNQKQKKQEAELMLMKKKKSLLYKYLRRDITSKGIYEEKEEEVCLLIKYFKFGLFLDSGSQFIQEKREKIKKVAKVQRNHMKYGIKTLRKKVKESRKLVFVRNEQQNYLDHLVENIQKAMAGVALKKIYRLSDFSLNSKYQVLYKKKFSHILKFLSLNKKKRISERIIKHQRGQQILLQLINNKNTQNKLEKLCKRMKKLQFVKCISTIRNNLKAQSEEEQTKIQELEDHLSIKRQKTSKQIMITRMKNHCQLKENMHFLMNYRVKQSCRQLVKLYLKQKSNSLKEFMALRHYAGNVKRKGMRALKKSVSLCLLKQNKTQIQNNSKILKQRSIDNVRRKSKLIQTIQRYNMSRVSRVIR